MKYWIVIKLYRKVFIRFISDLITKHWFRFSKKSDSEINFEHSLTLSQEIKQNETFESKLYNFSIASNEINQYLIKPNEIFSFWNIIGNPKKKFRKGRTIKNGKIIEAAGGGLCQVSGIIYYISLIAGLKILERHNHSIDIYNDDTRFCPLGTDATLVYGYKDLRIVNTNHFPIKFELQIAEKTISIKLLSTEKIEETILNFKNENQKEYQIITIADRYEKVINISKYKKNY